MIGLFLFMDSQCSEIVKCLNDNQGTVMAVLTLVYVLTTIVIAALSLKATRLSQRNIDTLVLLEKNRLRPYVIFNISSSTTTRTTHALLTNVGLTSAHDIKVSTEPLLNGVINEEERESALTTQKISLLPPGEHLVDVLGPSPSFHQRYPEPLFKGSVEYKDAEGIGYKENFQIDLTFLKKRLYVGESTTEDELNEMNATLKKIAAWVEANVSRSL